MQVEGRIDAKEAADKREERTTSHLMTNNNNNKKEEDEEKETGCGICIMSGKKKIYYALHV